jgi:hypothetical protein
MSAWTPSEPAEAVHPRAFDRHLTFKRHARGGEEGNGSWEIVDDDANWYGYGVEVIAARPQDFGS